jgi:hypothetical protein
VPKYRVVWFRPGVERGKSLGTLVGNSDEEIISEVEKALELEPDWSAEIWRPDRKLLVARLPPRR